MPANSKHGRTAAQLVTSAWNLRRIRGMEAELTPSAATCLDILDSPELTAKLDRFAATKPASSAASIARFANSNRCKQTPHSRPRFPRAPPLALKTQITKRTQALADHLNGAEEEYWSAGRGSGRLKIRS